MRDRRGVIAAAGSAELGNCFRHIREDASDEALCLLHGRLKIMIMRKGRVICAVS